ncbi:MAG: DUF5696 domain-containing protein [bacterium]
MKIKLNYRTILILSLIFLTINSFSIGADTAQELDSMEIIAENEYLILYMNEEQTNFAVEEKASNDVWFSNPVERDQEAEELYNNLSSQVDITHDPDRVKKSNYAYSVINDQFDMEPIENGARVEYTFVEEWRGSDYMPNIITEDRLEEKILSNLDEKEDRESILDVYTPVELVKLPENKDRIELEGIDNERLFGDYTLEPKTEDYQERSRELDQIQKELSELEEDNNENKDNIEELKQEAEDLDSHLAEKKREVIWHFLEIFIENRHDIEQMKDITFQNIASLTEEKLYVIEEDIPPFIADELAEIFENSKYTPLDAEQDHILNNLDPMTENIETFRIPIEYTLKKQSLIVRIPTDEVLYPKEVIDITGQNHSFPLLNIGVLPHFSAADNQDEGYIFVPDGSGALINLNNGKTDASDYNEPIYGQDYAQNPLDEKNNYPEQNHMPVFGMKKGDKGFLAIIEKGDALARIKADIAGMRDNYNRVYAEFNTTPRAKINLEQGGSIQDYQSRLYKGDIQINYNFLSGDSADYSGMAKLYQKYLVNKFNLERLNSKEKSPFVMELVGGVPMLQSRYGLTKKEVYPMTSYNEAREILGELIDEDIENIDVRYTGWMNGGLEHFFPDKINVEERLGGEKKFNELLKYAAENDIEIYPDISFLNVYREKLFDNFSPRQDASRYINRLVAKKYDYNLSTYQKEDKNSYYILSPSVLGNLINKFLIDYKSYDLYGLSLSHMGTQLNSDFRQDENDLVDRQQSLQINIEQLKKIHDENKLDVLVEGGNAYVLPYVSTLINMPLESSSYSITDQSVPFYQLAVSGYLNYTGDALNLSEDLEDKSIFLKLLETGALPYFSFSYENSSVLKDTDYDNLYSTHYREWLEESVNIYKDYIDVKEQLNAGQIIRHEEIADQVFKVTYNNQKKLIINYKSQEVKLENGQTVEGEDYLIIEEGDQ